MSVNNMGDLLKNAGKIRKQIDQVQEDLKERVVEGKAGDGLISVMVNGQQELLKLSISPDIAKHIASDDPDDIELLEDMIVAAVSQGMEKAKELKEAEIGKVTGGMAGGLSGLLY